MFRYDVIYESKISRARVAKITTPHGVIDTPNYVPVATNASIKSLDTAMLAKQDSQLIFCNTYHLALHPGGDVIENAGGLHKFMNRKLPIITDSGGFQVFSLAYGSVANELKSKGTKSQKNTVLKINEKGVTFRSYRDGSLVSLTPESSVALQKQFGSDIIIPLDELPPYHCSKKSLENSLARTHRWQERSLNYHLKDRKNQAMYAVVHGGVDKQLRKQSCEFLSKLDFDGFAIGGSLGKNMADVMSVLEMSMDYLPSNSPKHLLGIADMPSIANAVKYSVDTFDSCYPTKAARHGVLLFSSGAKIKISSSKFKQDFTSVDDSCSCWCCKNYTRAYIHHLFKAKEPSAHTLATIHNIQAMIDFMKKIREDILAGKI